MTAPRRLEDGTILAMVPGLGPKGEIAEGLVAIGPDHPLFPVWDAHLPPTTTEDQP